MTIFQNKNIFAAKNLFRSQSVSIIPNFLLGRVASKCASLNFVTPLVQGTFTRFFSCDKIKDRIPESATPEEKAWYIRLIDMAKGLKQHHTDLCYEARYLLEKGRKIPPLEEERFSYRKRWATYRLINKIEDVARRLIDENVDEKCQMFYLADRFEKWMVHLYWEKDFEVVDYNQCWQSLLKSSEHPLAEALREKLVEANIKPVTFSQSISKVYLTLQSDLLYPTIWSTEIVGFGPDDIKEVLKDLPLNNIEYECVRILFNLEESEKWQIKDCEKVQYPADYLV